MMSSFLGGVWTPPPPLVIKNHFLAYPPPPLVIENHFLPYPPPPLVMKITFDLTPLPIKLGKKIKF